ncbi:MAG: SRPBCC family protein [Dehalococcoidia bacterium]
MLRLKKSIVVNCAVERVFDYLTNFRRHEQWDGAPDLRVVDTSPGTVDVGSWCLRRGIRHTQGEYGTTVSTTVEKRVTVTESVPNIRIAFKDTETGGIPELILFELERVEGGTRITKSSGVPPIAPWFWPFWLALAPVVWPSLQIGFWLVNIVHLRRIRSRLDPYYINQEETKRRAERQRVEENQLKQIERIKVQMVQRVAMETGISHTKLSGAVKGESGCKQEAIRQLLDEKGLRCEQKGRVRRYFVQQ